MRLRKERVLIVTAKWPKVSNSTDGGDSTVEEIIHAFTRHYIVDVLCFRNDLINSVQLDCVRKVMVYSEDFAVFSNYSLHNQDKFIIRIQQSKIAATEIERIADDYDLIVIQHNMFVLGLGENQPILDKVVLYPMFTGTSYIRAGEVVPSDYINLEKKVLYRVGRIFTPSVTEKDMLILDYGVPNEIIRVIPRPVKSKYNIRRWHQKKRFN